MTSAARPLPDGTKKLMITFTKNMPTAMSEVGSIESTPAIAFSIVWKMSPCSMTTRMPRPMPMTRQANIIDFAPSIQVRQMWLPLIPPTMPAIMPIARNIGDMLLANQSSSSAP